MRKKITFGAALPILFLALAVSSPVRAATTCQAELSDIQAQWHKTSPNVTMEMGNPGIATAYHQAADLCARGKEAAAEGYLDTVRENLNMPQHLATREQEVQFRWSKEIQANGR